MQDGWHPYRGKGYWNAGRMGEEGLSAGAKRKGGEGRLLLGLNGGQDPGRCRQEPRGEGQGGFLWDAVGGWTLLEGSAGERGGDGGVGANGVGVGVVVWSRGISKP